MKKLISIVILSALLLGGIGGIGTISAADVAVGGSCCAAAGDTCVASSCDGDITAVPATTPASCSTAGTCVASAVTPSAGSPNVLRESCTIRSNINWTDGEISGTICTSPATGNCILAKNDVVGPTGGAGVDKETDQWGMICLINSVNTITNWIFYLLMIIVVVMVVIGGATYMLSAGNPESAGKGKSIIIYGIIGLVIALLARLIPSLVKVIVGMG